MVGVHHKIHRHFAALVVEVAQGVGAHDGAFFRRRVAERRQRDLRLPRAGNQQFEVGAFVVLREVAEIAAAEHHPFHVRGDTLGAQHFQNTGGRSGHGLPHDGGACGARLTSGQYQP